MTELKGYHAHVYYNPATKADRGAAARHDHRQVRGRARRLQRRSDRPASDLAVQRHLRTEEFQNIVPWLMLNREGLDVLVHPLTESSYDDHSKNALWIGTPVPMRLDILRPTYSADLLPTGSGHPA